MSAPNTAQTSPDVSSTSAGPARTSPSAVLTARLGFPDTWVSQCSPTQTRKQCGNAMSVNVLYELVKKLLNESQIDASGPGSLSAASLPSSHSA